MNELFISTSTFGSADESPLTKLMQSDISFSLNPHKRKLSPEETTKMASDAKTIIAGIENLEPLVNSSQNLQFICRLGVGLENVPFELCKDKGIKVSFTPEAVTPAISELTISLMLSIARHICSSDRTIRAKKWQRKTGTRIGDSIIGLIGFGRVGQMVADLLVSFKPKAVLVHDIHINENKIHVLTRKGLDIKSVTLEALLQSANIISLHVGLNHSTNNMITAPQFKAMRDEAILVNTSRGGIVNEQDLYHALKNGDISAAALDVFEEEPYYGPLTELDNIILSPHQGSATRDCRAKMEMEAVDEVIRFFNNDPLKQEIVL